MDRLNVKVMPRSSRDQIVGGLSDALKIKFSAPPDKRCLEINGPPIKDQLEPEQFPPQVLCTSDRFDNLLRTAFLRGLVDESKVAEMFQVPWSPAKEIISDWLRRKHDLVADGDL